MKVKILSMQRIVNYGSFMQAYALKRVLESFGHDVSFCDFKEGEARHIGNNAVKIDLRHRLKRIPYVLFSPLSYIKERIFRHKLNSYYETYAWQLLGLEAERNYDYKCDTMIIGSDEVFNYTQSLGYVPALFGHGLQSRSTIAYAACSGYASAKDVEADNMSGELSSGFAKFDAIGVRDKNTYEMVSQYSQTPPTYVIDPTLLYDFEPVIPAAVIKPGYLLVYAYNGRLDAPDDVQKIVAFAKQKQLRIVSVGFFHAWCDENLAVKPFELLSIFKHASYVVTDTFHGTIFSIKNRKQFVSLLRKHSSWGSNTNKLGFLLSQLNLESRVNKDLNQLAVHLDTPIDYEGVYHLLNSLREESLQFLANELKKAQTKLETAS